MRKVSRARVDAAIARGINFLDSTREPYGLLFMGELHHRFGVTQFTDALERYDQVVAERPDEAAVLRVLRRVADANNPIRLDDWNYLLIDTDRILATSLYCDQLGLPDTFAEVLGRALKAGGYEATHALLAWIWIQEKRCRLAVPEGFVDEMYRTVAAILQDGPTIVSDLKLEAAAFLCLAHQISRVDPGFVRHVVVNQRADGSWVDPTEPDGSSWHSTALALCFLLHVSAIDSIAADSA